MNKYTQCIYSHTLGENNKGAGSRRPAVNIVPLYGAFMRQIIGTKC